jgi:CHAT domain-containing protein
VASHGLFNEARPRYSGLVLSPDPASGDDGFLSISEVLALDLDCDQVVLSACASALGPHVSGEGRVGLTRSFIFAGARSVVSALWDVSGQETARFLALYYARLGAGGADRDEALAAAKRAMWAEGAEGVDPAHPAFWAAFVLSGAGH